VLDFILSTLAAIRIFFRRRGDTAQTSLVTTLDQQGGNG
jgi:hypothetical protein